jgi:hypothetical protein
MTLLKRIGTTALLLCLVAGPATAQQVALTDIRASVRSACLTGGSADACRAAVQAYISALKERGVTGASLDDALASLASSLADSAVGLPAEVRAVVSSVIRDTIAPAFNDRTQAAAVVAVADDVSTGTQTQQVAERTDASDE